MSFKTSTICNIQDFHLIATLQIEMYKAKNGAIPFQTWLESLKDNTVRYRIKERLDRVALGNLGDFKAISEGVFELRLAFGPGYRIYFGKIDKKIILLLSGGDKSTQKKDIKQAGNYWHDYLTR